MAAQRAESSPEAPSRRLKRILTVGDGDLTLSLALVRAYGRPELQHRRCIEVVASVLEPNPDTLLAIYPEAPLAELDAHGTLVRFGIDATQLHKLNDLARKGKPQFDLVTFHHPHLGLACLQMGDDGEAEHAQRHYRLLCHYLYAASQIATRVHVCLCGTQPDTWRLLEAASRQGLVLVDRVTTAAPFARLWREKNKEGEESEENSNERSDSSVAEEELDEVAPAEPHFAAPRRYRNGKLGSFHFLGKYGYRHRRTEGDRYTGLADMNVTGSMHFVFARKRDANACSPITDSSLRESAQTSFSCSVCTATYSLEEDLRRHYNCPARPDVSQTTIAAKFVRPTRKMEQQVQQQEQPLKKNGGKVEETIRRLPSKLFAKGDERLLMVPNDCEGKRLRWFLQHHIDGMSKRRAELLVQAGCALINGAVVVDSSRILKVDEKLAIRLIPLDLTSTEKIEVVGRSRGTAPLNENLDYLVVWKPSGMRVRGKFSGTLEDAVSKQEGKEYVSLSAMETSCPGLCVLVQQKLNQTMHQQILVRHTLTILVHGHVPQDWHPSHRVSIEVEAKWKSKKRKSCVSETAMDAPTAKVIPIEIVPKESSSSGPSENEAGEADDQTLDAPCVVAPLSTIEVVTTHPSSSSLCQFFRQKGYPVVGDSFTRKEYLTLPRSLRNRLKDKLCMGCFKVEFTVEASDTKSQYVELMEKKPIPDKLSAWFWSRFLVATGEGGAVS